MDLDKNKFGLKRKTGSISSHDADHIVNVKVEEVSDLEEEEVPMPIICQTVKVEHDEVSCICICTLLNRIHGYSELSVYSSSSLCICVCMKQIHSGDGI
jgi:hypothetical protein